MTQIQNKRYALDQNKIDYIYDTLKEGGMKGIGKNYAEFRKLFVGGDEDSYKRRKYIFATLKEGEMQGIGNTYEEFMRNMMSGTQTDGRGRAIVQKPRQQSSSPTQSSQQNKPKPRPMSESAVRDVYDQLSKTGDARGTYEQFRNNFVGDGVDRYHNRLNAYRQLKAAGANVPGTYEEFMRQYMTTPSSSSAPQKGMTMDEMQMWAADAQGNVQGMIDQGKSFVDGLRASVAHPLDVNQTTLGGANRSTLSGVTQVGKSLFRTQSGNVYSNETDANSEQIAANLNESDNAAYSKIAELDKQIDELQKQAEEDAKKHQNYRPTGNSEAMNLASSGVATLQNLGTDYQNRINQLKAQRAVLLRGTQFGADLSLSINGRLAQINQALSESYKYGSGGYKPNIADFMNKDIGAVSGGNYGNAYLNAAKNYLADAQKMIAEAKAGSMDPNNLNGFFRGAKRGLADGALDVRTWDYGITDYGNVTQLRKAADKWDRGENLTYDEQVLLDAMATKMSVDAYFASGMGRGYKAGKVTAESIPFMIEMLVNPASATGKSLQAIVARYALKNFGKKGLQNVGRYAARTSSMQIFKTALSKSAPSALRKEATRQFATRAVTRAGGDALGAMSMSATTGQMRVWADALNRMTGQARYRVDNHGLVRYDGHDDPEETSLFKAYGKAFFDNAIQNHSEMVSAYIPYVGQLLKSGLGRLGGREVARLLGRAKAASVRAFNKLPKADMIADLTHNLTHNSYVDIADGIRKRANIGGPIEEYLEEVIGNAETAIVTGDMDFSTEQGKGVFNLSDNIDTFLGVSLMTGAFSVFGAAGYRTPHYRAVRALQRADEAGQRLYEGNEGAWEQLKQHLDECKTQNERNAVLMTALGSRASEAQKQAVLGYVRASQFLEGAKNGTYAKMQEEAENDDELGTRRGCINSYMNGQNMTDSQSRREALLDFNAKRNRALALEPDAEFYDSPELYDHLNPNASSEQRKAVSEYAQAKAKVDGINDAIDDRYRHVTSSIEDQVGRIANTSGNIIEVELEGRHGKYYVRSGNISVNPEGYVNHALSDRTVVFVDEYGFPVAGNMDASTIEGKVKITNAQSVIDGVRARAEEVRNAERDAMNGILSFNYGSSFNIIDESGEQHKVSIVQDEHGNAVAQMDGAEGVLPLTDDAKATLQSKADMWQQMNYEGLVREQEEAKAQADAEVDTDETAPASTASLQQDQAVAFTDADGNVHEGRVNGETADGGWEIEFDHAPEGKGNVDTYTSDELNALGIAPIVEGETAETAPTAADVESEAASAEEGSSTNSQPSETQSTDEASTPSTSVETSNVETKQRAIDRIPTDGQGQHIYEQASVEDTAAALIEQMGGDVDEATENAKMMLSQMQGKAKKAAKRLEDIKDGKVEATMDEIVQAKNSAKVIGQNVKYWEDVVKFLEDVKRGQEAVAQEEARAKLDDVRDEREAEHGVPDWTEDRPQDARGRGFRIENGSRVDRQGHVSHVQGKEVEVKFSDKVKQKGHVVVMEADALQPSHLNGQQNVNHFIPEAQPKDRTDQASVASSEKMASQMNPAEITSSVTAYIGAPSVNARGEVIQGNNRSAALKTMWEAHPEQADAYKQYLMDHAEEFGLNADDIAKMEHPVLVNMMDVDDAKAIELGQYDVKDTESGGTERIKAKNVSKKMGQDMRSFASILLSSDDEDASLSQLIDRNGAKVLEWMNAKGYITPTQYKSAFDSKGELTAEAKNDLKGILFQNIFQGGTEKIEEMFNRMPAKAQRAMLSTAFRDYDSAAADRMLPEIQNSIVAFNELMQDKAFASAKNMKDAQAAILAWMSQYKFDEATGESYLPTEKYSNFALQLAAMYKVQTQGFIQDVFNQMFDLIQGTKAKDLFNQDTLDNTPLTLAQAIKEVLNIDYNGIYGSDVLAGRDTESQGRRQGSEDHAPADERSQDGERVADSGGGTGENLKDSEAPVHQQSAGEGSEQDSDGGRKGNGSGVDTDAAGGMEGADEGSRLRMFEEEMAAQHREHPHDSERNRRKAESERLVSTAKKHGVFVPIEETYQYGGKVSKRTGESVGYIDRESGTVTKVKDPYAKSAMKSGVQPEDAGLEHLVHNLLFPETAYTLKGITEKSGEARLILSQDFIPSNGRPTKKQIAEALAQRGLMPEDNYSFGNEYVSVTDVEGDNVILGLDGQVYFIDPIIRFKKPLKEILDAYETKSQGNSNDEKHSERAEEQGAEEAQPADPDANLRADIRAARDMAKMMFPDVNAELLDKIARDLNQQPLTRKQREQMERIAKAFGLRIRWFKTMPQNGTYSREKGEICIATDSWHQLSDTFGHEMTHALKDVDMDAYNRMKEAVIEASARNEAERKGLQRAIDLKYSGYDAKDRMEEYVSDKIGAAIASRDLADKILFNLDHKVLGRMRDIVTKMRAAVSDFSFNTENKVRGLLHMEERVRDERVPSALDNLQEAIMDAYRMAQKTELERRAEEKRKQKQAELEEKAKENGGVSSVTDAASVELADEDNDNTKESMRTEDMVEARLRAEIGRINRRKTSKVKWSKAQTDEIINETRTLMESIHAALEGNPRYDEWAKREPTMQVDWRDGKEKPVVTWSRNNVEYKFDVSADLLCINNEGIEAVLSSPDMVELMLEINKATKEGFTSADYMRLYETMRDLGLNVPCKGCFDAAARLKMLPSVSRNFVDLVNQIIDERNADPEAFDAALKEKAKEDKKRSVDGLPVSYKSKEAAIRAGVAGDNLTEHISWPQLMSAQGQTKALSDWGGIFRAWQRTGAGRPKDKLLPEPYIGDLTTQSMTVIAPYGEKTPSFREQSVNVGTGLRRNSHSELRPFLAIDEIQFMRDAFIKGLLVFKYMKELDDVRLFGKMGVKFNMSFFPAFDKTSPVAGLDKDGNYIASEESVGSREFPYTDKDGKQHFDGMKGLEEAGKYVNENVSLSSVVFSVPHLIKALTDVPTHRDKSGRWGSLVPFHSSGAESVQLARQGLGSPRANGVGHKFMDEAFTDYGKGVTNFEDVQNDRFGKGWTVLEGNKAGTDVEEGHKLEFSSGSHYYNQELGLHLFSSWYVHDADLTEEQRNLLHGGWEEVMDGKAWQKYKNQLKKKVGTAYSIDYNDKVREIGGEIPYKEACDHYIQFLSSIGLIPRFDFRVDDATFQRMCADAHVDPHHPKLGWVEGKGWSPVDSDAYYSLWCDYGMTDPKTGAYSPHRPVGYIDENGNRTFRMPEDTVGIVKAGAERFSAERDREESMHRDVMDEFIKRTVEDGKLTQEQADEFTRKMDGEGVKRSERVEENPVPLEERVARYDEENGTELGRFVSFLERGRVLENGESSQFLVGKTYELLQRFGIKGDIFASSETVNPLLHTLNEDHELTSEDWYNALNSINDPLAICRYRNFPNSYRIYTMATINDKFICVGVDVNLVGNGVEVTNIKTAFGRDIEQAISRETILYPEGEDKEEQIRRKIEEFSPAPNSQVYPQQSVSAANVANNSDTRKTSAEENGTKESRRSTDLNSEYGTRWLDEQTNEDGRHTTQVKNTINSYKKFGEWVKRDSGGRKVSVLDASSGLGLGTQWMRENGIEADDVEPYPSENREEPTFRSYDDVDKKYDYIISNAVLNVIPEDWRENVLHNMADKLKDGGKMVINVRSAESIAKQGKEGETRVTLDEPSEILVLRPNGSIKAYQKGFTKPELKEWCEKELGNGYSVEIANSRNAGGSYDTAVVVTKGQNGVKESRRMPSSSELALRDGLVDRLREAGLGVSLSEEEGQRVLDLVNGGAREHKVYHGSHADFDHFDHSFMNSGEGAQAFGWGSYVTEVEGIGRTYAKAIAKKQNPDFARYDRALNFYNIAKRDVDDVLKDIEEVNEKARIYKSLLETYRKEGDTALVDKYARNLLLSEKLLESFNDRLKDEEFNLSKRLAELNDAKSRMTNANEPIRHLYTVEIPDDTGSNYLDWDKPLTDEQKKIILNGLRDVGDIDTDEWNASGLNKYGEYVYMEVIPKAMGFYDDYYEDSEIMKATSEFLSEIGFTGIKYPADYMRGGRTDGAKNYVIFNDKDLEITDHVRFFRGENGEAYGFTVDGKIYIDPKHVNAETPIHEYAHLWATALQQKDAKAWGDVVELMKGTGIWDSVREAYPELKTDDEIADEVLATYSGQRGAERLREEMRKVMQGEGRMVDKVDALSAMERVRNAIARFWRKVAEMLGIRYTKAEDVADNVLGDLLDRVNPNEGVETDAKAREMGSKVKRRMNEISGLLGSRDLSEKQKIVMDVFTGLKDRQSFSETCADGISRKLEMQQGNEGHAGTKHCLFRHYGTNSGVVDVDDLLSIPTIFKQGERNEVNGSVTYTYYMNGIRYRVNTDVKGNKEIFHDFYSNRNGRSNEVVDTENGDTLRSARTDTASANDAANVANNSESSKSSEENGTKESRRVSGRLANTGNTSSVAQRIYEEAVRGRTFEWDEAWHDSLVSVKALQDALAKERGADIRDLENVYLHLVHLSSVSAAEMTEYRNQQVENLLSAMNAILKDKKLHLTENDVETYLNCKHGLERNEHIARKKAKAEADEKYGDDLKKLQDTWVQSQRNYQNNPNQQTQNAMDKAQKDYTDKLAERDQYEDDRYDKHRKEDDYSGLTAIFDDPKNPTMTNEELEDKARDLVADMEQKIGQDRVDDLWDAIHDATLFSLRKSYKSGLISKETYNEVKDMYEWYVPLRGFAEDTANDVYEYMEHAEPKTQQELKNAKGRTSRSDGILANIMNMGSSAILHGNQNLAKQKLLNLAINSKSSLLSLNTAFYKPSNKMDAQGNPYDELVQIPDYILNEDDADVRRQLMEQWTQQMEADPDVKTKFDKLNLDYRTLYGVQNEHAVSVFRGGKQYMVYVNGNPRAAQAINGTNIVRHDGALSKAMSKVTRWMSQMMTSYNPSFVTSNAQRDFTSALLISEAKYGAGYTARFANNVRTVFPFLFAQINGGKKFEPGGMYQLYWKHKHGTLDMNKPIEKYFSEFMANGGETGYTQSMSVDDYKNFIEKELKNRKRNKVVRFGKKPFGAFMRFVEELNRGIENSCRFAAYMTSRETGRSVLQSVQDAKEVSTNFNLHGSGALGNAFFRDAYAFTNPAIQSLVQYMQLTKQHPKKMLFMAASTFALGVMTTWMMASMVGPLGGGDGDDDKDEGDPASDFWNINPYTRRNYLLIPIPKGKGNWMKIAMAPEIRAFYGIGVMTAEALLGRLSTSDCAVGVLDQLNQLMPKQFIEPTETFKKDDGKDYTIGKQFAGSMMPTSLEPIYRAWWINRDFMGKQITNQSDWNEDRPEWQRASYNTSEWLVNTAKWLNNVTSDHPEFDTKGYINFNPSRWGYLTYSYFGGIGQLYDQGRGLFKGVVQKDEEFDERLRYIPVINRMFTTTNNEYNKYQDSNARFQYYEGVHNLNDYMLRNGQQKIQKGEMGRYEMIGKLWTDPDYNRGLLMDAGKWLKQIDKLKELRKATNDEQQQKEYSHQINEVRKNAVRVIMYAEEHGGLDKVDNISAGYRNVKNEDQLKALNAKRDATIQQVLGEAMKKYPNPFPFKDSESQKDEDKEKDE